MTIHEDPVREAGAGPETSAALDHAVALEASVASEAFAATALAELRDAKIAVPTRGGRLSPSQWRDLLRERESRPFDLLDAPIVALSARRPWDPAARLDVFQPGRWDTTYDLVFLASDYAENSRSIGYVDFVAPADGVYLVALRFSGHQTSMRLTGPWGLASTSSATTSDHPTVTAVWTGSLGSTLHFSFSLTGGIMGYLEEIAIHQVS
ncbi:hypothetical protein ET445_04450 [Agromyces protaetiae]|uniref:Uncharacterized protein n=1 Tax=Agromyces protaetiae TaxID=2509455 RepID=A0A4P6FAP6_9MICO|nr:hypothetical protein [Agromyces protaetiae]QAY72706.1 hypothetical protein ET445_04450 [Agromyces protaetiae]